ncbi:MAG: TIGR03915 family putative DNA repair protein [Lachnospiraceae bacterium]|jgi:probable DNA metabolism protein|nr:TIGR03915 family putative DNA repair protein [Lachnospiraceae bacterium]
MELYLICEDSLEGIFTGIYEAYALKRSHQEIHLQVGEEDNLRLFSEYRSIQADSNKAAKVARTINREFGQEGFMAVCRALASNDAKKGDAIYKMVVSGLAMSDPRKVMSNLANEYVMKVFELARFSANEAHFLIEFLRFKELENGILYARTGPKNNVLTFVMPHFSDRLPLENFVIHDEGRGIYGLHPARKDWYVVTEEEGRESVLSTYKLSAGEELYSELFTAFFHTIAVEERVNRRLQRNMLPLRYREYMTEFQLSKDRK